MPGVETATAHGEAPVAIVTGAARGIGRAIVDDLLQRGWRVAEFDRSAVPDPESHEASSLSMYLHRELLDVRDEAQMDAAVERVRKRFGRVDAVVANAAVGGPDGAFTDLNLADIRDVIDINYFGVVHAVRSAVSRIRSTGGRGRVVLVGSLFEQQPVTGASPYISSKGAVQGLMHALALELAPEMTVNSVAPGYIMTEMHREELAFRAQREGTTLDAQIDEVRSGIPLARHGAPADIAAAVSFLLSEEAAYITGQTLNVNGGVQIS